jgi:hypothetical protein
MADAKSKKYFTLSIIDWESYESKCLRNNAAFEIGFIKQKNKPPDKFMVYPVKRVIKNKTQITYHLAEHILKNTESIGGYSKFIMECRPSTELELVKNVKDSPFGFYRTKPAGKTHTRKISPAKTPITKIIL